MIWRWWDRFAAWWDWGTALIAALITCGVLFVGVAVYFFMHNLCAEWVDKPCTHSICTLHGEKDRCLAWVTTQDTCRSCARWEPNP